MMHARTCSGAATTIRFFEHAWAKARSHEMPQAIVTVNPDLFTRFVVPNYALDTVFDTIVTSWQEGTEDKARLCEIALERLGGSDPAEALLIDNIEANVDAWRATRRSGLPVRRRRAIYGDRNGAWAKPNDGSAPGYVADFLRQRTDLM